MTKLLILFVFTIVPVEGSAADIERLFRSMLIPGTTLPLGKEFQAAVGEAGQLPTTEVRDLLPLAQQALKNDQPQVRNYGLQLMWGVTFRQKMDIAELLTPYLPDLEQIIAAKSDPLRRIALSISVSLGPKLPAELLNFLSAHLEDEDNADQDTGMEARALMQSGDRRLRQQVFRFVEQANRPFVTSQVLRQFGVNTIDPDVLFLIEMSLDTPHPGVRGEAVLAVTRMEGAQRTRYLPRLSRMATDPKETSQNQSLAAEALKN